jgi:hypothetical protein
MTYGVAYLAVSRARPAEWRHRLAAYLTSVRYGTASRMVDPETHEKRSKPRSIPVPGLT